MDGHLHLHAGLGEHRGIRSDLHRTTSATRVTSDPEKKPRAHKHKSHHHYRDHEDRHRHSSSKRRTAKEAVQAAIQPPTSFGDLLKQARGSKDTSPTHSRKGSVAPEQDKRRSYKDNSHGGISIPPPTPHRPEDVEKERLRVQAMERDLHTVFQSLSDQSLKTSRRLDDTYYSILEKNSTLQQTIGTLQDLSGLTKTLQANFESDTKELVNQVSGQVAGYDNFQSSQRQVNALEERIKLGKQKADSLTARLARARERVYRRARSEAQWQATNTHRLRILWGLSCLALAVIAALVLFHRFKPIHALEHPHTTSNFASRSAIPDAPIPGIAKDAIIGPSMKTSNPVPTPSTKSAREEDERLRIFDEL